MKEPPRFRDGELTSHLTSKEKRALRIGVILFSLLEAAILVPLVVRHFLR